MKQIESADLLICDEWGYIPFEKDGSRLLFQVISECYEKRSLIVTTNLEFSKWNGIFLTKENYIWTKFTTGCFWLLRNEKHPALNSLESIITFKE